MYQRLGGGPLQVGAEALGRQLFED